MRRTIAQKIHQFIKYLLGMQAGICFEYVYRVEFDLWYLPLIIGICSMMMLTIDSFIDKNDFK